MATDIIARGMAAGVVSQVSADKQAVSEDRTAVEAAKLVCNDEGEWEFEAVGEGHDGGMQTLIDIYA